MSIKQPANETEARELYLLIRNDYKLEQQQLTPILKMLVKRKRNGSYDNHKAIKAFENLARTGAAKYDGTFSPATRRLTAVALWGHFENEYPLGNFDHLI